MAHAIAGGFSLVAAHSDSNAMMKDLCCDFILEASPEIRNA